MDRDEAAMLLVVLVSGALVWLVGALTPASPTEDERAAWRRIWLPALPASIPFFILLGFAVADPEGPQPLHVTRAIAVVPFGVVWIRAALRAVRALTADGQGPAVTKGFLWPRVELSAELCEVLHQNELRAVMAHEGAHVGHRDPLRIWLVQALTDLQWPLSRARARQRVWLRALELARDAEAVSQPNVEAAALASAMIKAARLVRSEVVTGAALTNDEALLETRVRRLLILETKPARAGRRSFLAPLAVGLAIAAFVFGLAASASFVATLAGSP